jgi:hypothetical protein
MNRLTDVDLETQIDALSLDIKARRILTSLGVRTVTQLLELDPEVVLAMKQYALDDRLSITGLRYQLMKHGVPSSGKRVSSASPVHKTAKSAEPKPGQTTGPDVQSGSDMARQSPRADTRELAVEDAEHRYADFPFTFPIQISIAGTAGECMPSSGSLLRKTLPEVFGVLEGELDTLWRALTDRRCCDLGLDVDAWAMLAPPEIYSDDPLNVLLSMTIGKLIEACPDTRRLHGLICRFTHVMEELLGRPVVSVQSNACEDTHILEGLQIGSFLHLFHFPRQLLMSLARSPYKLWEGLCDLSERTVISDLGLNESSISLISALWNLRGWIKAAGAYRINTHQRCCIAASFDEMFTTAVTTMSQRIRNGRRDATIALSYFLSSESDGTLDNLALTYRITRQAVSNVIQKIRRRFSSNQFAKELGSFWLTLFDVLCSHGGAIEVSNVLTCLQGSLGWVAPPQMKPLGELLVLSPAISYDKSTETVYLSNLPCLECEGIRSQLRETVAAARLKVRLDELCGTLRAHCNTACTLEARTFQSVSSGLVRIVLQEDGDNIKVDNGEVYSPDGWAIRKATLDTAVEVLLKEAGELLTLSEVLTAIVPFRRNQNLSVLSVQNALLSADNLVRCGNDRWAHVDSLGLDEQQIDAIVLFTNEIVSAKGHVSVKKIFREKRVSCRVLHIETPLMLYDILRLFAEDDFELPRYPNIHSRTGQHEEATLPTTLTAGVSHYVKQKKSVCSVAELQKHFAAERGFAAGTILALLQITRDIIGYGHGTVVHSDTIGWNPSARTQLERVLLAAYESARQRGKLHALLSHLFEASSLPTLPNGVVWTLTLLSNLARECDNIVVLGTAGNAFVSASNGLGIESTDDLMALLLTKNWGGAANVEAFTKHLQEQGIIKRRLTRALLSQSSRVTIDGHEIRVVRTHEC